MTTIVGPLPNIISDGQIIDAVPVMNDFNWIVNQVNANGAPNNVNFPLPALGSLINVRVFSTPGTSTYTPTSGTNSVIAVAIGGGGAGGGAPATGASQVSCGSAGGSGGWGVSRFTFGFSGASIIVGAGGVGSSGSQGGAGSTSSFNGVNGGGGLAGGVNGPSGTLAQVVGAAGGSEAGANLYGGSGAGGDDSLIALNGVVFHAKGGSNPWGTGGNAVSSVSGFGGGGSGTVNGPSSAAQTGNAGGNGAVIIYEYA